MPKAPITVTINPTGASDPRKYKKYYMAAFDKRKDLYDYFLLCWDEAVEEGAVFTADMAWIKFRKRYVEGEEGWVEREEIE